ncbi:MAG: hypothetical protein R2880_05045 [Deinococcales bacterium]
MRGVVGELEQTHQLKGEMVLVISAQPNKDPADQADDIQEKLKALKAEGLEGKTLRHALMALGLPRNLAYELSLQED